MAPRLRGQSDLGMGDDFDYISSRMIVATALENALSELQRNLDLQGSALAHDKRLLDTFRTAAIKSFEYAYELSVRLMRRHLELRSEVPGEIDALDFRTLMRVAAEKGVIDNPLAWVRFREKRNITSHTYDEAQSLEVLAAMPEFIIRARYLLQRLVGVVDVRH